MDYEQSKVNIKESIEGKEIESDIKNLWDKIRKVSEIMFLIKEENKELKAEVQKLKQKFSESESQLIANEREISQLHSDLARLTTSTNSSFPPQEKEIIKKRISELIAKINSHL